jgi:hypothetical protein
VIRAFAHDLKCLWLLSHLGHGKLIDEAVDAIIAQAGRWNIDKATHRFHHGKTDDDKSWDISREILDTGRCSQWKSSKWNHSFHDKTIADFVEIKRN